jgi:hypothetical protein
MQDDDPLFASQFLGSTADRVARDAIELGHLRFARQFVTRAQLAGLDHRPQIVGHL